MNLDQLRVSLKNSSIELIHAINKRHELADQIQTYKINKGMNLFDPEQEWQVFSSLSADLSKLSMTELYAFSVIAQSQATAHGQYPQWSCGEHLQQSPENLYERTNPILLSQLKPDLILNLKFNHSYEQIQDFIQDKLRNKQ